MRLTPGTRLGSYEVKALLGRGGMSEVYRARDTRLNRDVAVKVLADWLSDDAESLARFEREAHVLASLNHPHIAQIYGFEEHAATNPGGPPVRALVMELIEGPTLGERIAQGAVPLEEALSIAQQIAGALEIAHERGIIHRDLKPANVKLTPAGVVKVLDFGLAKLLALLEGPEMAAAALNSPTPGGPTMSGVVLGTAAYMAPEQARGQPVDRRADVWAFGVLLYEMLAGHRPFQGATVSDTIAAVLRQDIDWERLPTWTPGGLRRVLKRCLERNATERFHDAGDVRLALADLLDDGGRLTTGSGPTRPARWARWVAAAVAIAATAVTLGAWQFASRAQRGANPVIRFTIEPPPQVAHVSYVAAAPDGRFIVYEAQVEGEFRLFLRRLDELESRPLAGTEGGRGPFVSPDGAWIAFVRAGKIYRVPTAGGDALPVHGVQGGPGAAWTSDGQIVFSRAWLSGLSMVSGDGGTPTVLTEPDRSKHEIGHWWPSPLPDGRVLFTIVTAGSGLNDARIGLLDGATRTYRTLFPGAKAEWLPSGHIVFYRAGRYHAIPFDVTSSKLGTRSFPVLDDARELDPAGDWSQTVALASTGALAYLSGPYVPASRLTWIDTDGTATPLPFAPRPYVGVKLSPDGRRAATASYEAGRLLLRVFDLERGTEEELKIEGMNWNPVWLPDGRLSFTSMRKGDFDVYIKDIANRRTEQAVLAGPDDTDPVAWTADGRMVFQGSEPDGTYPLKLADPRHPSRIMKLTEQHVENGGSLSPDERWLVYHSAASGRSTVYVRSLNDDRPAVAVSREPGEFPVFLRDGRTLALVRGRRLVVRSWRTSRAGFEVGPEHVVTQLAFGSGWTYGAPYDVAEGGRFLALVRTEDTPPPRIRVVLGWNGEVGRLGSRSR